MKCLDRPAELLAHTSHFSPRSFIPTLPDLDDQHNLFLGRRHSWPFVSLLGSKLPCWQFQFTFSLLQVGADWEKLFLYGNWIVRCTNFIAFLIKWVVFTWATTAMICNFYKMWKDRDCDSRIPLQTFVIVTLTSELQWLTARWPMCEIGIFTHDIVATTVSQPLSQPEICHIRSVK